MEAGAGISILNPYEWLPPYGENAVILESRGLDLVLKIEYDAEEGLQATCYRELRFDMVCAFSRTTFPGVPLFNVNYSSSVHAPSMGALIEYPTSEATLAWKRHFGNSRSIKHFKIAFLSENVLVEIFASSVTLGDEVIIASQ
ncbi:MULTISPECIES: hypothetical protein [unclassified Serratia (in: enterobacteria)]|uniref:hypothetical protein n=1 Tax=unclassified Serratia (in: enterobacteria) TaxID=2647522 RepID=UPI00307644E4